MRDSPERIRGWNYGQVWDQWLWDPGHCHNGQGSGSGARDSNVRCQGLGTQVLREPGAGDQDQLQRAMDGSTRKLHTSSRVDDPINRGGALCKTFLPLTQSYHDSIIEYYSISNYGAIIPMRLRYVVLLQIGRCAFVESSISKVVAAHDNITCNIDVAKSILLSILH